MDAGPDSKRARHHYDAAQRIPPTQDSHQSNSMVHTLPNSSASGPAYAGMNQHSQQAPPVSHFGDIGHDGRNITESHAFSAQHPHSAHTTPREARFPSQHDIDYSRRGSAAATPRSPSGAPHEHQQYHQPRNLNIVTTPEGQTYHSQYAMDHTPQAMGYPPQMDQGPPQQQPHMNGNTIHHGMPLAPPDTPTHPGAYPPDGYVQSPLTAGPPPYGAMSYGPHMGQPGMRPKKGNRATQACDVCRTRKAKCDEGRPRCGFCVEQDLACNYQSVAPAKVDRANQAIIDQIETTQKDLKSLKEDVFQGFDRIEKLFSSSPAAPGHSFKTGSEGEIKPAIGNLASPPVSAKQQTGPPRSTSRDARMVDASPTTSFNTNGSDPHAQDTTSAPSVAKQNAIQAEHNTAAQKLFRWPAIRILLKRCKGLNFSSENSEKYVLDMELRKGPLHLYGRGSGPEGGDGGPLAATATGDAPNTTSGADTGADEPADSFSSDQSSSSQSMLWGYGISPHVSDTTHKESNPGGLCADNTLKLDSRTVQVLVQSYQQNMHILHPFLDDTGLSKTIETFKRRYGSSSNGASQGSQRRMLEKSPATAVVLLVMALGKICECRERLPGPIPCKARSETVGGSAESPPHSFPMQHSPPSSHSNPAQSPTAHRSANHHSPPNSSFGSGSGDTAHQQPRNVDVIPGLAYYAAGTDILGNLTGSHDTTYVQCCLLAGLYAGQLTNIMESLTWIQAAARSCCILARDSSLQNHPRSRQNSIRLAFYTALQLENDILAELDLPQSGIRRIEGVAYPDGYFAEDTHPPEELPRKSVIMQFYSYQLHLRKLLDWIQQEVYPPGKELTDTAKNTNLRTIFNSWLENDWRSMLPQEFNWTDNDHLPRDINHARLRGKYFGALYIIHRPMVHYALELENNGELDRWYGSRQPQQQGTSGSALSSSTAAAAAASAAAAAAAAAASNMGPPSRSGPADASFQDEVMNSARIAIQAAIQSTLAFDGAMEMKRLIVTNIFGTAHAQFGNMLVLSAVYKSRYLRGFLGSDPRRKMDYLFKRTINFLGSLKPISATLGHDQFILQRLREVVFEGEDGSNVPTSGDGHAMTMDTSESATAATAGKSQHHHAHHAQQSPTATKTFRSGAGGGGGESASFPTLPPYTGAASTTTSGATNTEGGAPPVTAGSDALSNHPADPSTATTEAACIGPGISESFP